MLSKQQTDKQTKALMKRQSTKTSNETQGFRNSILYFFGSIIITQTNKNLHSYISINNPKAYCKAQKATCLTHEA